MILGGVKYGNENANDALSLCAVSGVGRGCGVCGRGGVAAGEEGAGEIADGSYDHGEVVAPVPEAVVGGLVAEDLVFVS